jgi:hypothetical protein
MKKTILSALLFVVPLFATVRVVPTGYATFELAAAAAARGDTIRLDADTVFTNASITFDDQSRIVIIGNGTNGTVVSVGDHDGIRLFSDSISMYDLHFRYDVQATSFRRLISTNWNRVGKYLFQDCSFDTRGGINETYARGISLYCNNTTTGNFQRSFFKRCHFYAYGNAFESGNDYSMKNVTLDSCYINCMLVTGMAFEAGAHITNTIIDSVKETKIQGDSVLIENVYNRHSNGEGFTSDDLDEYTNRVTIRNLVMDGNEHVNICPDGGKNWLIDNCVFARSGEGSGIYVHNENVYDSTINITIKNLHTSQPVLANWRQFSVGTIWDSCTFYPAAAGAINIWSTATDTLKNSKFTYYPTNVDTLDTLNLKTFSSTWMLDTTVFAFVKMKYRDSLLTNKRGAIAAVTSELNEFNVTLSNNFRHANNQIGLNFLQANSYFTGDTAEVKVVYKESSSGAWLAGAIDTGKANDNLTLTIADLTPATEYNTAVIVRGISDGTTHLVDTTATITFTTEGPTDPVIDSIRPTKIYYGKSISYYGKNLGTTQGNGKLFLGSYNLSDSVSLWTATRIDVPTDSATIRGWYHSLLITDAGDTIVPLDSTKVLRPYWIKQ